MSFKVSLTRQDGGADSTVGELSAVEAKKNARKRVSK